MKVPHQELEMYLKRNPLTKYLKDDNCKIIIACSTGADSMALLNLAIEAFENERLIVAHVNHNKRAQSEIEEEYIRNFCHEKNIMCFIKKLPHYDKDNFQEWAREERYQFFKEIAENTSAKYLFTAHHADDNLETILMRLIKGSNLKGYAGISSISTYGNLKVVRPLLGVSKKTLEEYLIMNNYKYFQDESNASDVYTRNRIRKYLVPFIKEENPNWINAVQIYSDNLNNADILLKTSVNLFIKEHVMVKNNSIMINLTAFLDLSSYMKEEVLFLLLKKEKLSLKCIKDIIKKIESPKNKIEDIINPKLLMVKEYNSIIFTSDINKDSFFMKIEKEGTYDLPYNGKIIINKNICNFLTGEKQMCYNIQGLPLIVRSRKDGDKIHTKGGTKKINDLLTNRKISQLERNKVLLLLNQEEEVLAVLGYKI